MVPWATDAGTSGEVKITSNDPGHETSVVALPAGSSGTKYVRWLHGTTLPYGPLDLHAQVRRTAGAGNVYSYPIMAWVRPSVDCTSAGTWL